MICRRLDLISYNMNTLIGTSRWIASGNKTVYQVHKLSNLMVFTHYGLLSPIEHGFQYTSNFPAAWVVYHNLGLHSLGFTTFQLLDSFSSCRIIRAITRLQSLKQLQCSLRDYSTVPIEFILALLKGLPPSVEPIMVDSCVDINNNYHSLLRISFYTDDEIVRILESYPALKTIVIPWSFEAEAGARLANTIR
ncbi:hypothetical protein K457DRAFT_18798 [Linnemannia elongata AG-77]|uniref:Uncharacterized protein n=1 Tax=Linnemannia elongata AG-77 TaxID=1314771 RepID=A0A197JZT1_9FUNG|nr:hypothetical protein K457DRAFT_18798 [Linnemannia elongata AG-77]